MTQQPDQPERTFRFQQFDVRHDRSAMKVGTDGVLLGAWAGGGSPQRILDVGTGSGLVALMLAQRFPEAQIHAVEIDDAAAGEAADNFQRSPWADRLKIFCGDVRTVLLPATYSLIVSNPPWYDTELAPPDAARSRARHSESLSAEELIDVVASHLDRNGRFAAILPVEKSARLISAAHFAELKPVRTTAVSPNPSKPIHRTLLEFGRNDATSSIEPQSDRLTIETDVRHAYTAEFAQLVRQFYLRYR